MAAITAALIKQVREDTGAGMMDVKKALTEAEGDVARAKEIIRAKGIQAAGKREGRKAQEGTIASKVIESAEGQTGYAVELNSETDFVAKTPKFVEFADTVLGYAVAADANNADELGVQRRGRHRQGRRRRGGRPVRRARQGRPVRQDLRPARRDLRAQEVRRDAPEHRRDDRHRRSRCQGRSRGRSADFRHGRQVAQP